MRHHMTRLSRAMLLVAVTAGGLAVSVSAADTAAATLAPDCTFVDRLAWSGSDPTSTQIWVADADGTDRSSISTADPDPDPTDNMSPDWSPDGRRIAWHANIVASIQVADADGSDRGEIYASDVTAHPQWSPDGERIAFVGGLGAIITAAPDGTDIVEIAPNGSNERPVWSPDGTSLAWNGFDGTTMQIMVANATTKIIEGDIAIAPGGLLSTVSDVGADAPTSNILPQWSPDGTRIAWSGSDTTTRHIWVANADGSGRSAISDTGVAAPTENTWPVWSPDGTRIAWAGSDGTTAQIWVADPDGSSRASISDIADETDPTSNGAPRWSPDGTRLAWAGDDGTTQRIWVADADGLGRATVSDVGGGPHPVANDEPAWEPAFPFLDVVPSFAFDDIACVFGLEIAKGTTATTFSPAHPVTREQMAAFLARLWRADGGVCPTDAPPFTDLTGFTDDIACIYGLDITKGTSDTEFSPADAVTREQMAAFLARLWRILP